MMHQQCVSVEHSKVCPVDQVSEGHFPFNKTLALVLCAGTLQLGSRKNCTFIMLSKTVAIAFVSYITI